MNPMGRRRRQKAFYRYFIVLDIWGCKIQFSSCVFIIFCFITSAPYTAFQDFCSTPSLSALCVSLKYISLAQFFFWMAAAKLTMVELEAGLITRFASLVLPFPSPKLSASHTLCGQEEEGCLKLGCFQICCRVKGGLYGLQLCLFDGFLAFYSSAACEPSSLPLHSGGWIFYRAAPSCDMIILKSRHGLYFVVGDWPLFGTEAPISAPFSLPLDLLHPWKSGMTFPLQSKASLMAMMSPRSSNSCLWHYGTKMQVYRELKWNQDNVCINKSG